MYVSGFPGKSEKSEKGRKSDRWSKWSEKGRKTDQNRQEVGKWSEKRPTPPGKPGNSREFYFRHPGLKRAGKKIAEAKIRETAGILIIGFVLIKKERITTRDIINQHKQSLQR